MSRRSRRRAVFEKLEWRRLLASISGTDFSDLNANGVRDPGEPALAGWTVYLDVNHDNSLTTGEPTSLTNSLGEFSFTNLSPGNYTLEQSVPNEYTQTFPTDSPPSLAPSLIPAGTSGATSAAVVTAIARASDFSRYTAGQIRGSHSWVVGLSHGASIKRLAAGVGATSVKRSSVMGNMYVLTFPAAQSGKVSAAKLSKASGLGFFFPVVSTRIGPRSIPDDALFGDQWQLDNTGQAGGTVGQDANITGVWDNYQGNGVTIAVVDDGVDTTHPDLSPNYNPSLGLDVVDNDSDPTPAAGNNHGTQVAGVAAARGDNGIGISGAAPQATLAAIRLFNNSSSSTDQQIADALSFQNNAIDIYNNSWGPADNGQTLEGPGPLTLAALQNGVTSGRGGLGNIYVWAAGNGLLQGDNTNYDGYANSRYTLAVTALDQNGQQPLYAEPGAPILVSAYASGVGVGAGSTSTNVGGGYTSNFGETSAAAPLVSGVVALMLQANPDLGWRDVEHILALSAAKNDAGDSDWIVNGAGLHVNDKYGFGAIDAAAAVNLAQHWNDVVAETSVTSGELAVDQTIPDDNTTGLTQSFNVTASMRVETVEVVFDATHAARGQLHVVLTSPDGTESVLADVHNDPNADYDHWVFTTKRDWDEMAAGTWTLKVTDETGGTVGTWNSWQLNVYGAPVDPTTHDIVIVNDSDAIAGQDFGNHDISPPAVASAVYSPAAPTSISLHFDDAIDDVTLDRTDLTVAPTGGGSPIVPIGVDYDFPTFTATFALPDTLPSGAYTATLAAGSVSDLSGNTLDADFSFNFGEDANPPIASAGGPYSIAEGQGVSLDASGSHDTDPGQFIVSYQWDLNGDNNFNDATGVNPTIDWSTLSGLGINDDGTYTVSVRATNNLGVSSDDSASLVVTNTPPTSVTINGPTSGPEGSEIDLTAAVVDPGNDSFTYAWSVTKNGSPFSSGALPAFSFTPDDNGTYAVSLTVTDDDLGQTSATPLSIAVSDVEPTIAASGNSSTDEGALYTLTLGSITDPGADTVTLYRITWGDGSPAEMYTPSEVADAGGIFTHVYVDGPYDRTIQVKLGDEDGMHTAATLNVDVNNLDPTGTLANGGDVNIGEDGFVVWLNPSDPSSEDAANLVYDFDFNNDGVYDVVGSLLPSATVPGLYLNTPGPHTVIARIRDNDGLAADGPARDGVLTQSTTFQVIDASFRVLSFTPNSSGFSVHFNKSALLGVLNLYDGNDVNADLSDLVVTRGSDPSHPIPGSLVWDAFTNTATWVASGGVLPNDTYGVTLTSGASAWTHGSGDNLDGEPEVAGLQNFTQNFIVNASTRVISLPDFARGQGQTVNLPTDLWAGIPITLSNPQGVTSVDFNLYYNPQLLTISAAALASGVPGGWSITPNFTSISATLSRLRITMSGSSQLSASTSAMSIVKLTASVPSGAILGQAQVIRIEDANVNGSSARGDYSVHAAAYVGDANGNGTYTGADSALISRVVAEIDSGFDFYPLIDPKILADVDANGQLQGQDSAWVLQKSLSSSLRPEIPDIPGGGGLLGGGADLGDVQIDIPEAILATTGEGVSVPVSFNAVTAKLFGFTIIIDYDKNKLSLADGLNSADVTQAGLLSVAGGWTMGSFVDQASGRVVLGFYREQPVIDVSGTFANLNFHVAPGAAPGNTDVTPGGLDIDPPISFGYSGGTVQIVSGGPTVTGSGFNLDGGGPMSVQVGFSADVSASLQASDFVLTNLTTAATIPSAAINIQYIPGTNTAVLTFPGFANGILPDGNYHLVVNKAGIFDSLTRPLQADASLDFFFLNGDANRDRVVDIRDLTILSLSLLSSGSSFAQGDFNFDGVVNDIDLGIVAHNWQQSLSAPAGSLASAVGPIAPTRRASRPAAILLQNG